MTMKYEYWNESFQIGISLLVLDDNNVLEIWEHKDVYDYGKNFSHLLIDMLRSC